MKQDGISVLYDDARTKFVFDPEIRIQATTTCKRALGFPSWFPFIPNGVPITIVTESLQPIRLCTIERVHVESRLTINNIPLSGRISCIPVSQEYNEMIEYYDVDGNQKAHCLDYVIQRIEVWLTDQDGTRLEDLVEQTSYPIQLPEWQLCIGVDEIVNGGYRPLQSDNNVAVE